MSRVIVTGAAGFIGAPVVTRLAEAGHTVVASAKGFDALASGAPPANAVVHLAASSRFACNVDLDLATTDAVIDYCRAHGAACVFASTAGVYRRSRAPQDENAAIGPDNVYAKSKLAAEGRLGTAVDRFGMNCTILRLFNVYGPRQRAPFVVPYVVETLVADRPLEVRMPDAIRDFVLVDDVARAFVAAVDSPPEGMRVINVGSGQGTRIADLVTLIARLLGKTPRWARAVERCPDVPSSVADVGRARQCLGWRPMISLEDGLRATCNQ